MIDASVVDKVAKLGRLSLTEEEKKLFASQLSAILGHFEQLAKVKTEGIEPMVTPTDIEVFWREDVAKTWESPEVALSNAPEKSGNLFKVPPVV